MENQEKLIMLEELMELERGTLTLETSLSDIEEWDSVTILSVIVMIDDEFNRTVKGLDIKGCKTVGDIVQLMEE